jgi:hypothetical protein
VHTICTGRGTRGRHRPHRAGCAAAALTCFAVAAAYLVQAWRIVFSLRIGPVVAVIDEAHGHGIHSGDFIGVACALAAFALIAAGALLLDDAFGPETRLAPIPSRLAGSARRQGRPWRPDAVALTRDHATTTARRRHRRAWNRPAVATA